MQRDAVGIEPAFFAAEQGAGEIGRNPRFAKCWAAAGARDATSAAWNEIEDHTIPYAEALYIGPQLDDFATGFVAQHHGRRPGARSVDDGQIRVAQTRCQHTHAELSRAGRRELDRLNDQWL